MQHPKKLQIFQNYKTLKMKVKFYKIENSEGIVFEDSLTLEEAKKLVTKWENDDKQEGIYTPNFYLIKKETEWE